MLDVPALRISTVLLPFIPNMMMRAPSGEPEKEKGISFSILICRVESVTGGRSGSKILSPDAAL